MALTVNRFTPAFAGRRPDGPTPAPPGPDVRVFSASANNRTVYLHLVLDDDADDPLATLLIDWGDRTPREPLAAPWTATHTYPADSSYEIRAIARSAAGRESLTFGNVQVGAQVVAPIPEPVADFTWMPTAPTTATPVTLDASLSTPAAYIDGYEWQELMGDGDPWIVYIPATLVGPLPVGPHLFQLRVHLSDGRWSAPRARGFMVTAAEIEEPDEPEPDPEPEPEP